MPIRFPMLILTAFIANAAQAQSLPTGIKSALNGEHIGLLDTAPLTLADGICSDCASSPPSRWYFQHEVFAAPTVADKVAGVIGGVDRRIDIRAWAATPQAQTLAYPSVTWIGAPQLIERARLDVDGSTITPDGGQPLPFILAPKLASNRAYVTHRPWPISMAASYACAARWSKRTTVAVSSCAPYGLQTLRSMASACRWHR